MRSQINGIKDDLRKGFTVFFNRLSKDLQNCISKRTDEFEVVRRHGTKVVILKK